MFHRIIKLSSTAAVKAAAASPRIRKFSSTEAAAAASPISVLYPKINKKVVRGVMEDQTSLIGEESKKPAAAAGPPPLEISLRPFELTDVDDIMVWGTDEQLSRYCGWGTDEQLSRYCGWKEFRSKDAYCGWLASKPKPHDWFRSETYMYCGRELETYRSKEDAVEDIKTNIIPHPWFRAIVLNNRPIGKIFVDPCRRNNPYMAELGYVVASQHWGKGIATTAVKMVLGSIFKEWPHLRRLQGHVHVENLGAQKVLEKAGFQKLAVFEEYFIDREGRKIDMAISSFVSTDFNK